MEVLIADLRYTCRAFRHSPAFFSLVIGILALGITASVSVFSLVDGILLRPLPYRDPLRLVTLTTYAPKPPFNSNGSMSYNDYRSFQAHARSFSDLAITFRTGWSRVTLTGGSEPAIMQGAFVSPNLFALYGRSPLVGRTFTEEENRRAERVVVISEALWAGRFASSPQVLGQDLEIARTKWRIIGVMPSDFAVPFLNTQLWAPILSHTGWNGPDLADHGLDGPFWDVMARLKPGVSLRAAQAEVDLIESQLKTEFPDSHSDNVRVVPLREHFTGNVRKPMLLLFGAVAFLLLIACSNVANLLLARVAQREGELAIRSALGAAQSRLWRQLITEALAFSSIGGAFGIAAAIAFIPVLKALSPADTPLLASVTLDIRALLFASVLSIAIGVLLGIAPAWRFSQRRINESINITSRATEPRKSRRLRNCLVAAEFAFAMVLLTGAGLLIRSFVAVLNVDPGFHSEHVLTIQLGLPNDVTPARASSFYADLMTRLKTLPSVQAVGGASNLFFLAESRIHALRQVEGHPAEPTSLWKPLVWTQISGDYFQSMGIPLLKGRFFTPRDRYDSPTVAIINQALAQRYWPGEDPIGKRLKGFDPRGQDGGQHDDWLTVVGMVQNTRSGGLEKAPFSQIYEVQAQRGEQIGNLVVRTAGDPAPLAAQIRALIHNLNPSTVVSSITTMEQLLDRQKVQRRFETWLIAVFSGLALCLAALGIFAVMHYSVAARTAEMGIRIAVGATSLDITKLVLGNGALLAIAGIAAGALAAVWITQAISGLLFAVTPEDPVSFAAAALLLFIVSLLGGYLPARRASHLDPISALHRDQQSL